MTGSVEYLAGCIRKNLGYQPTPCQDELFNRLAAFVVSDRECDIMVVAGYAGTGKTTAIGAFVRTLKQFKYKYVLLSPTGRSAKVLSSLTGERAGTIHRHIYRQKGVKDGIGEFKLDFNKHKDTFFIVDEASLIQSSEAFLGDSPFGSGDLLSDLVNYVRGGVDDKLVLIGDRGQLPPIGMDRSPALDCDYMGRFGPVASADLSTVVRQASVSGILSNATLVRHSIEKGICDMPKLQVGGFDDLERIDGSSLVEALSDSVARFGLDNVVVLCRSNKRANRYNAGIRSAVLGREERLCRDDKLMIVKNCYQFIDPDSGLDFIANGDIASLVKISHYEERYGIHFADAVLSFPDYNDLEISAKIILDTLESESPALTREQQNMLYQGVDADYGEVTSSKERYKKVREDKYFNALQIKYATALTAHKAQGGQWDCVFIDNPFWKEIEVEDLKWLYTAMTRAVKKIYFVNFKDEYFI